MPLDRNTKRTYGVCCGRSSIWCTGWRPEAPAGPPFARRRDSAAGGLRSAELHHPGGGEQSGAPSRQSAIVSGWLFDLYPTKGGMVLWIVDEAGNSRRLTEAVEPAF